MTAEPKKYLAGTVPRFLRQSRLGYLPMHTIIGSRLVQGDGGANLYYDIVMLPAPQFQRMRANVGLQHVIAPALNAGPSFNPGFVIADTREIIVPATESDPEGFAREHFRRIFKLDAFMPQTAPITLAPSRQLSPFQNYAATLTVLRPRR